MKGKFEEIRHYQREVEVGKHDEIFTLGVFYV